MSTIPDPRSRTMSPANDSGTASPSAHPDLNTEVATLSNKLINAINHQTNLDDTLSATRHELEEARERIRNLETENQDHAELLARGILIRKSVAEVEKSKLIATLAEERRQRAEIEKEKKSIELELENLTTALFEEANKMVITAREAAQKEHDLVTRKNEQLRGQLADTESLLKSHQEQLSELKQVMEQLTEEREEQTNPTAPSTPGLSKFDSKDDITNYTDGAQSLPEPVSPSYPTSFTHLVQPVLRTDLSAFEDFTALLRMSKNVVSSRASSGSYGGTIGLGLGLGGYSGSVMQQPSNGSTSSISTSATLGSSPATPTTPASTVSSSSTNGPNSLTPLKDTKFYKRALAEDIEPALRLDTAPGLSWLARRTVLNAVCDGNLVIEPMPTSTKPYVFACSLCGETRKDPAHIRSHRFRTSESENAQRYPLCRYCHGRVRSTCDFLGFLRILKDGHWRADDEQAEKAAWEESVRLREQMFWCRMGGGVVPAQQIQSEPSPRVSADSRMEQEKELAKEIEETGEIQPRDVTPVAGSSPSTSPQPTKSPKRASRSLVKEATTEGLWRTAQDGAVAPSPTKVTFAKEESLSTKMEEPQPVKKGETLSVKEDPQPVKRKQSPSIRDRISAFEKSPSPSPSEKMPVRESVKSTTSSLGTEDESKGEVKRLSITIPGSVAQS